MRNITINGVTYTPEELSKYIVVARPSVDDQNENCYLLEKDTPYPKLFASKSEARRVLNENGYLNENLSDYKFLNAREVYESIEEFLDDPDSNLIREKDLGF